MDRKFKRVEVSVLLISKDGLQNKISPIYCVSLDLARVDQKLKPDQIGVGCPGIPGEGWSRFEIES